jgi:hypothetical protein
MVARSAGRSGSRAMLVGTLFCATAATLSTRMGEPMLTEPLEIAASRMDREQTTRRLRELLRSVVRGEESKGQFRGRVGP